MKDLKQLIEKAKEKGFVNRVINEFSILNGTVEEEDIYIYLYLCELKKWLMDKHKILVIIDTFGVPECCYFQIWFSDELEVDSDINEPYQHALLEGLTKALELT